jgi:hypothetical protein
MVDLLRCLVKVGNDLCVCSAVSGMFEPSPLRKVTYHCASTTTSFSTPELSSSQANTSQVFQQGQFWVNGVDSDLRAVKIEPNSIVPLLSQLSKRSHLRHLLLNFADRVRVRTASRRHCDKRRERSSGKTRYVGTAFTSSLQSSCWTLGVFSIFRGDRKDLPKAVTGFTLSRRPPECNSGRK